MPYTSLGHWRKQVQLPVKYHRFVNFGIRADLFSTSESAMCLCYILGRHSRALSPGHKLAEHNAFIVINYYKRHTVGRLMELQTRYSDHKATQYKVPCLYWLIIRHHALSCPVPYALTRDPKLISTRFAPAHWSEVTLCTRKELQRLIWIIKV